MAYARRIAGVTEEEVAAAMEQRKQCPEGLLKNLTLKLHDLLHDSIRKLSPHDNDLIYYTTKYYLDCGADPNRIIRKEWGVFPLTWAVEIRNGYKTVALLLAYGADPNKEGHNPHFGAPIADAADLEITKLLVRAGASLNATDPWSGTTLLMKFCGFPQIYNFDNFCNLDAVVWLLSHGADPNIGSRIDYGDGLVFAINLAISHGSLFYVIALLQIGARLDIGIYQQQHPIECAYRLWQNGSKRPESGDYETRRGPRDPIAQAQYEFLIAINNHKLDPHIIYKISEYEAMGISHDSAELIQKATQEVNEAFAQCRLDDWQFEHQGQSLSKLILKRELGYTRQGKR